MSDKHLLSKPHNIGKRDDAWWYEVSHGISVIVEPQSNTTTVRIPWRSVRAALARKDKT